MRNRGIEYPAPREIRFKDLGDPPALTPTQVRLETVHSGVTNGTERHALLGEHFWKETFPSAHGYQHVARVAEAGAQVKQFAPGDLVFFGHYVGHRAWNIVEVGPDADAGHFHHSHLTIKLPPAANPAQCALLGVAGVAMRGVRRARIGVGDRVWVAGLGLIGQFAAQAARAAGAQVTVSDVNRKRLELAKRCGAHTALDAGDADVWERLKEGGPYDCIVDACGVPSFLMDAFPHRLVAHRARILMLAVHTETVFNWGMLHIPEASIEVSCHFSLDDLRVLLQLLERGELHIGPLITHRAPIADAIAVYEELRDDPRDMLGIVFDW